MTKTEIFIEKAKTMITMNGLRALVNLWCQDLTSNRPSEMSRNIEDLVTAEGYVLTGFLPDGTKVICYQTSESDGFGREYHQGIDVGGVPIMLRDSTLGYLAMNTDPWCFPNVISA